MGSKPSFFTTTEEKQIFEMILTGEKKLKLAAGGLTVYN